MKQYVMAETLEYHLEIKKKVATLRLLFLLLQLQSLFLREYCT